MEHFFCEAVPTKLGAPPTGQAGRPIELTTELTDMEDGSYELTFTLPVQGQYEVAVKLFDAHISGSPFKVSASNPPPEHVMRKHTAPARAGNSSRMQMQQKQRSKSHMHPLQGMPGLTQR